MAESIFAAVGLAGGLVVGWVARWLLGRSQLAAAQKQLEQSNSRAAQLEALLSGLRRKLADAEAQLRQAEMALQQPDPTLEQWRQQAQALQQERAQTLPRLRQLEDELAQARQQAMVLQTQSNALKARLAQLEDDVVHARQRAATAEGRLQEVQEQLGDTQRQLEPAAEHILQLERELEQARRRIEQLEQEAATRLAAQPLQEPSPSQPQEITPELPAPAGEAQGEIAEPTLSQEMAYCVRCKTRRVMLDPQQVVLANDRPALKGVCAECGTTLFRFLKR